jgi:hypothetical protein
MIYLKSSGRSVLQGDIHPLRQMVIMSLDKSRNYLFTVQLMWLNYFTLTLKSLEGGGWGFAQVLWVTNALTSGNN